VLLGNEATPGASGRSTAVKTRCGATVGTATRIQVGRITRMDELAADRTSTDQSASRSAACQSRLRASGAGALPSCR
jgi:hypothetical protein